ncbi:MAG: SWF/SNF helicase family protein [Burkholderiaceae bacterium]|nr:SWF/SNF helicase family protein [Burkholderiaceae bacterium]
MSTSSPRRRKALETAPAAPSVETVPLAAKKAAVRKKTPAKATKAVAADVAVAAESVFEPVPAPAPAKPTRKRAPAKKAAAPTVAEQPAPSEAKLSKPRAPARKRAMVAKLEALAKAVQPRPEFELGARPEGTLFGNYELRRVADGSAVHIRLRGSQLGHYRCSCTDFLASENGYCRHVNALLELLAGEPEGDENRIERVRELARGEQLRHSEVWLAQGLERQLMLKLGADSDEAWLVRVPTVLSSVQPEDCVGGAALRFSPEPAQTLFQLMQAAAGAGHTLVVDAEVWPQVAWSADTQERVRRLEAMYPQGPHSEALRALLREPLPAFRWESALFAVCAGRALLADDLGLGQQAAAWAALALWRQALGLGAAVVVAPADRHARWQSKAVRWLGAWPAQVRLADPDAPGELDASMDLLIVDAVQDLRGEQVLRALASHQRAHVLLLADRELLGEDVLAPLVAILDVARRGPLARLHALAPDASKREQREALETVMFSRRRRDLQGQLPVSFDTVVRVDVPPDSNGDVSGETMAQVRQALAHWRQHAYLSFAEQLSLTQHLSLLRAKANSGPACEFKAQALLAQLPQIVPAIAQRVLVLAQQDPALAGLEQRLRSQGLSVQRLQAQQGRDERQALLDLWRGDSGLILLASDAACAGLDLRQPGAALVHFDMPWNPAQLAHRVQGLAGEGAGLPVWHLRVAGSFDEVQARVHADASQVPAAGLDFEPNAQPFLQGADLQAFMQALAQAMDSKVMDSK